MYNSCITQDMHVCPRIFTKCSVIYSNVLYYPAENPYKAEYIINIPSVCPVNVKYPVIPSASDACVQNIILECVTLAQLPWFGSLRDS